MEGPVEWHGDVMPNRLKGLGLMTMDVKFAGAANALWAELEAAKKEGRGTVIFNWSPKFTDAAGFTFIDFPPYYEGCRIEKVELGKLLDVVLQKAGSKKPHILNSPVSPRCI
ncbi:MAG: hypothetical protein CM1200mP18_19270 [Gammaproteobacteria bacterium]|nr:MAG: hypothetical protein CM1200mP18_19270 [Gammaproteobacteria bacterium]